MEIRELMNELHQAHQNFKKEWNSRHNAKVKSTEKESKHKEPTSVIIARDKFWGALNVLYDTKLTPLEIDFRENPQSSFDEIIDFLTIDIPAYRCGYAKEYFLRRLKQIEWSSEQRDKLQTAALKICKDESFRREFNRWCRLMIKLADKDFVNKLKTLSSYANRYTQTKAKWMEDKILRHRKDLLIVL